MVVFLLVVGLLDLLYLRLVHVLCDKLAFVVLQLMQQLKLFLAVQRHISLLALVNVSMNKVRAALVRVQVELQMLIVVCKCLIKLGLLVPRQL